MSPRVPARPAAGLVGLVAVLAPPVVSSVVLAGLLPAPAAAADPVSCASVAGRQRATTTSVSRPFEVMGVAEAQRGVSAAAQVVGVVGAPMVATNAYLPGLSVAGTTADQSSEDSTSVAGLAAGSRGPVGPIGVATGARVVGVGVDGAIGEQSVVTPDAIAAGITIAVASGARTVVVAVAAPRPTPGLAAAVRRAQGGGVIVVAAVLSSSEDDPSATSVPGATPSSYPAALDGVLGVGVGTADGAPVGGLLASDDIDVVAPVAGAVVTTADESLCDVDPASGPAPAAALAAGEVGGLVSLLRARFPHDTPAQILTRVIATAAGSRQPDDLDGYGVVQAGEAARRTLDITPDGRLLQAEPLRERVAAMAPPTAMADPRAGFRTSLLWWGVLGGGGLALALTLRPLVAR